MAPTASGAGTKTPVGVTRSDEAVRTRRVRLGCDDVGMQRTEPPDGVEPAVVEDRRGVGAEQVEVQVVGQPVPGGLEGQRTGDVALGPEQGHHLAGRANPAPALVESGQQGADALGEELTVRNPVDEEGAQGLGRVEEEEPSLVLVPLDVDSSSPQRGCEGVGVLRHEHGDDRFAGAETLGDVVGQLVDGVRGMVVEHDRMTP